MFNFFEKNFKGFAIPSVLLISFCLNVAAMCIPYMTLHLVNYADMILSAPGTVKFLWEEDLPWAAVTIVGFSILFPFVKLFSILILWFLPKHNNCLRWYLHVLNQVGRFSLIDVFATLAVINLAYEQGDRFYINMNSGLPLFIFAILISMICSEILVNLEVKKEVTYKRLTKQMMATMPGWKRYAVPFFMATMVPFLVCSWIFPYIHITQDFLIKRSYSIMTTIEALWNSKANIGTGK